MKPFALSSPRLRALGFLGLLLACSSVKAQVTFDYDYTCIRFTDPVTGDPVTEYINYYETDASGDALYTNALPVYVGLNPDTSNPIWVDPGFSLEITNVPGIGPVAGAAKPLPWGGVGVPGGLPPGGLPPNITWVMWVPAWNKHHGDIILVFVPPGTTATPKNPAGPAIPIETGDTLSSGCYNFSNPVWISGCNVELNSLSNGDFSSVYAILGGGSYWPDPSPPSFYATNTWDLLYIGDSTNAFNGSGFGEADVQCNGDEFMTVATPEAYVGCIPEPCSVSLICISSLSLLARRHWKQNRKGILGNRKS